MADASRLERYAAQLEEDQAERDLKIAWARIHDSFPGDTGVECRYVSLVGYMNAALSVTASQPR